MDWNDYQLILAVSREQSIRGAARQLGVSHATVSRRLTYLNSGGDGPLLQKSPSGLWPTKAGQTVVEAAEKMEAVTAEARRRQRAVGKQLSGPLTISMGSLVYQYVLFDEVRRFAEQYPDIELTIDGTDALVDLDRAEADIVLRASATPPEHWVGRQLFPWSLSFYAHKDYLAKTAHRDLKWIAPPDGIARWGDWLEQSPYPDVEIGLTISDIVGRYVAIQRGVGMGRAACFMADQDPDLVRLPGAPVVEAEPFWLLVHPDFAKTERAKAALKFFAEAMQGRKALIQGEV